MVYELMTEGGIPVDLDELKGFLRVSHTHDDLRIQHFYKSAFAFCEKYTGLSFREQDYRLHMSGAEAALGAYLAKNPFKSVVSVQAVLNNQAVTLTSEQYHLSVSNASALFFISDSDVIAQCDAGHNKVQFEFKVDYGHVPDGVHLAAKMITAFYYENRGDTAAVNNSQVPPEALKILDQYRVLFL